MFGFEKVKNYMDCCSSPEMEDKSFYKIYDSGHDNEDLFYCKNCKEVWFRRVLEIVNWSGGDDIHYVWYTKITKEEQEAIRNNPPQELLFLKDRKSILVYDNDAGYTAGQPSMPRWLPTRGGYGSSSAMDMEFEKYTRFLEK